MVHYLDPVGPTPSPLSSAMTESIIGHWSSVREEILRLRLEREEHAIRRSVEHYNESGRKVIFPEARTLADLMLSALPRRHLFRQPVRTVATWRLDSGGVATLSSCLIISGGHENLDVVPKPETCEGIRQRMILSDRYSVYFRAIVHRNGVAVVFAECDQIIASKVLAVVHSRSIPGVDP